MAEAREWLERARSALALAALDEANTDIRLEDRCFQLQQGAEKSVKALLIKLGIGFPKTHDISALLTLARTRVTIPVDIERSVVLSNYAVQTRYPDDYEPIDTDEYRNAKAIATACFIWVRNLLEAEGEQE